MVRKLILFTAVISFFQACNDEPVDNSVFVEEQEEQEIEEWDSGTFKDKDGNLFFTGGDCDQGSPDYIVGEFVLEDLQISTTLPIQFDLSEFDFYLLAQTIRENKFGKEVPSDYKQKAKQQRFLQSRGFNFEHINNAFKAE